MKRTIKNWVIILVLLLDDAIALAVIFLVLHYLKIKLPISVAVVIGLVFGAFIFVIHKKVIPVLYKKKVTGSEGMIGIKGEVIEPLKPLGVIKVAGEYWKAKSVEKDIEAGEEVEVLAVDGLTLKVRQKRGS